MIEQRFMVVHACKVGCSDVVFIFTLFAYEVTSAFG